MSYDNHYDRDRDRDLDHRAYGPSRPARPARSGRYWGSGGGGGVPDGLLIGVLALLLGLTVLTWTATGLAGLFAHGSWPAGVTFARTPMAMRSLVAEPHDIAAAWPDAPHSRLSGYGLFWGLLISQLLVALVLTIFVMGTVARARAARAAHRTRRSRPSQHAATTDEDVRTQPAPQAPTPESALGAPIEKLAEPTLAAPAYTGPDTSTTPDRTPDPTPAPDPASRVHDAPGAVLVATNDPALWSATKDARAKLGPVHLFDPGQLCDTPDRLRWSPHQGCADKATAAARAADLLAPLRSPRPIDAETHTAAETLLRCWLHAAALDDRPFREVHRWAIAKSSPTDPVQTLRTHPKASPGAAGELEATLVGHPERRQAATDLIRQALSPLSQLHVRNACTATRADRIALESFIDETGTLYVVGRDPEIMPILNALTQSVVKHGRSRTAIGPSPGRPDPPLTTVLQLPWHDSSMGTEPQQLK